MISNNIKPKTLILARSLPGAGKSYLVNQIENSLKASKRHVIICSSDHFFYVDGIYKFDINKLGSCHKRCQDKCKYALECKTDVIIIDNTNVSIKECKIYVAMGLEFGYNIEFVEPDTEWKFNLDELEKRNQHNVPRHALEKMLKRWVPDMTVEKCMGIQQGRYGEHEDEKAAHNAWLDGTDLACGVTRRGQMFYKMYEERFGKNDKIRTS